MGFIAVGTAKRQYSCIIIIIYKENNTSKGYKMANIKKIRDTITAKEFKHLINYLQADTTIRASRKDRLNKMFHLLWEFGLRCNETIQLTQNMLIELLEQSQLKIVAHKQKKEKVIYLTKKGKKIIQSLFTDLEPNDNYIFTSERGSKNQPLQPNSVIRDLNSYLSVVFQNKAISSHSFRKSLCSSLLNDYNIAPTIVQQIIGHSSIQSTFIYSSVSDQNIMNSLELVR